MRALSLPLPAGAPLDRAIETTRYLRRWVGIAVLIGVVAGIGAIVFMEAIHLATLVFLGYGARYLPPAPAGEGAVGVMPIGRPWALPFITGLGGLLSGLIVFRFAPEAEGHGTDAAIAAIHHHRGQIRARVPLVKVIASAITIGAGGSAGREGPTAQISAGFGSLLGDLLHLPDADRRIAVAVGIGAGIGAIFRAPLGGAVLAAEILYLHDLEVEALIPSLIASIVGYSIFGAVNGFQPIFGDQTRFGYTQPVQLVYYAILGIVCGLVGILYARCFYGTSRLFQRLHLPRTIKPALGGLAVGALGLVMPPVLSTGYGWVQIVMGPGLLALPLWIVLLLPFAKILATSLSIGSSGSGGIFGPGMVIGAAVGASLWRLGYSILPGLPAEPAPFVIVGMMALFGGIAHAPLAVMLMVAEMTGNLSLLAPAMLAVGLAYLIVGDATIYASQLGTRADAPSHRARWRFPLLASLTVAEAVAPLPLTLPAGATLSEANALLVEHGAEAAVVIDDDHQLVGILSRAALARVAPTQWATTSVRAVMDPQPTVVSASQTLDVALEALAAHGARWLPVVAGLHDRRLIGIVTAADLVRTYRAALNTAVRGVSGLIGGAALHDTRVAAGSVAAGRSLAELRLTPDLLVLAVYRDGEVLIPTATTRLQPGDRVTLLRRGPDAERLRQLFEENVRPSPSDAAPTASSPE
ncbi:MAG: chloride channel protein [Chloroflexi bacterium]|nr:chloride channel protein [Chloroflexota bacterium]